MYQMKKKHNKTIALALILLLTLGLSGTQQTNAYFNDTETSSGNSFSASSLDFSLTSVADFSPLVTPTADATRAVDVINDGSLGFDYSVKTINPVGTLCPALDLTASLDGGTSVTEPLNTFNIGPFTFGATEEWDFTISLNNDDASYQEETCAFDIVFDGEQIDGAGFSDIETISNTVRAGEMVVLNEFLPRPNGIAYGFDFGNDSSDMPHGEWVELYNNSTESIDLTGWYLRDITNSEGNKTNITALNTAPTTTIIEGNNWLVVYMNKPIYNNTGDTVRLFNSENILVDSHAYNVSDFCGIEPTPGDDNSTDAEEGDCSDVPPNKSYARIPDGIGEWVDPIPTPGEPNEIEKNVIVEISAEIEIKEETIQKSTEKIAGEIIEEPIEEITDTEVVNKEMVEEPIEEIIEVINEEIIISEELIKEEPEAIIELVSEQPEPVSVEIDITTP